MSEIVIPVEDIIRWRRHIHQHPELSFHETQTTEYIIRELQEIEGVEITRPCPTGLVALVHGTAGEGPTIALRCDVDALPVQEENDVEFKSVVPGVAHLCGHDNHMAMVMGAVKVLAGMRHELAGSVKFIFQAAEELPPGGAADLVKAGVLDGVSACFGVHVWNDPVGFVRIFADERVSSACDNVEIRIQGKGSHASMPHQSSDPLLIGSELVQALHTIVSRNVPPGTFAVVSPTVFQCGTVPNVIADTATLWVNCRSRDDETRQLLRDRINEITRAIDESHHASVELNWAYGYGSIKQDAGLVELVKNIARETLGEDKVGTGHAFSASEDFAEYSYVVPSCFFTLGVGTAEDGYPYVNHHPKFNVDERCLEQGTRLEVAIALHYLQKK